MTIVSHPRLKIYIERIYLRYFGYKVQRMGEAKKSNCDPIALTRDMHVLADGHYEVSIIRQTDGFNLCVILFDCRSKYSVQCDLDTDS
jgi:hypothetical protein